MVQQDLLFLIQFYSVRVEASVWTVVLSNKHLCVLVVHLTFISKDLVFQVVGGYAVKSANAVCKKSVMQLHCNNKYGFRGNLNFRTQS